MQFTTSYKITNFLAFFVAFSTLLGSFVAQAASLKNLDVYTPRILDPHAGTVWTSGQEVTVTWDISNPPNQITNRFESFIILRKGEIECPVVVAGGFDILDGRVTFELPMVFKGDDWSVVLFGDSGNWSEQFTIKSPY